VLVRFKGTLQPGVTLRDLVNAIPWAAIQMGELTIAKKGKKNVFNGRILEIEGLPDLTVEQAFELADATAERSAAGCTIRLGEATIAEYLRSNVTLLRSMIEAGYGDAKALARRADKMEAWLAKPELLQPDADAEYAKIIEIDLDTIKEPLLACPNDPDDVKKLSEVAGTKIDEVFIGSCMTNIGHFRAAGMLLEKFKEPAPTTLWIAPPTRMDQDQLVEEGVYAQFAGAGARTEMPGCSLCMGNQARVRPGSTVVSTSTRNVPNRLGPNSNVFLASAELAAVSSILGRLPTVEEYMQYASVIDANKNKIFRYLSFDKMPEYQQAAVKGAEKARLPILQ
jgi:aconitate hydratase 2/2-methylisocitrate dehydratase